MALNRRDTMSMVHRAVETSNVLLAFQPVVEAGRTDRVGFYEGLIRLIDTTGRIIPARDFIDAVETTETGRKIDCLALEMGLDCLAEEPSLRLSVNMSARSIGYPDWMRTLRAGLERCPGAGERLILEITESSAIVVPDLVRGFMREQQRRGIAFALDDFGAGFTSFRYLRELYFDIIKIDGQFIRGIAGSTDNQVLTQALISVARHFDMFTVAESVENQPDAQRLADIGIDCMQGYYFGAPTIVPPWRPTEMRMMA
jgi:EAL domain-containing protein (putative c-di-GMP-specific phosphodiesterase class I)